MPIRHLQELVLPSVALALVLGGSVPRLAVLVLVWVQVLEAGSVAAGHLRTHRVAWLGGRPVEAHVHRQPDLLYVSAIGRVPGPGHAPSDAAAALPPRGADS